MTTRTWHHRLLGLVVVGALSVGSTLSNGLSAQGATPPPGTVSGRVTSATDSLPALGVIVVLERTSRQSTTGADGRYRIVNVAPGTYTVVARRLGYVQLSKQVTVAANADVMVDFALQPAVSVLNAVVTTATGEERRVELGNTIGVVPSVSVMRTAPVTTFGEMVSGRVPGALVEFQNGFTGSTPRIHIRGIKSFTVGNEPLLIVDGVRADNGLGAIGNAYGISSGRMADLNPDEFESLEIVKGPSAATLYGTDATNGVILIKTKRGSGGEGGRAQWRVFGESGLITSNARYPNNYYAWGHTPSGANVQCLLVQISAHLCVQDSISSWNPFQHQETTPIDQGSREKVGAQVSGAVNRFRYFFSGEVESETGLLKLPAAEERRISAERGGAAVPYEQIRPNGLKKESFRANVNAPLGENGDFSLSNGAIFSDTRIPANAIYSQGYYGVGFRTINDGWGSTISQADRPGELFALRNDQALSRYLAAATENWRPSGWLSTRATVGFDYAGTFLDQLQKNGEGPIGINRLGRRSNQRGALTLYSADMGATATHTLNNSLESKTSVGAQYNRRVEYQTTTAAQGLPPGSTSVAGGAVITGSESTNESIVAGVFAEQALSWRERLFLTAAARADGGSTFGANFHTAIYPKASISWLLSEERWMPRIPKVSSLRFRAAYGSSGVQPPTTAALPTVTLANALVSGTTISAAQPAQIGNPKLGPERSSEFETGLDVEFASRLNLELTYYRRESRDALINVPLAPSTGVTPPAYAANDNTSRAASQLQNIGRVHNAGFEAGLTAQVLERRSAAIDVNVNGSVTGNKLVSFGQGVTTFSSSKSWRQAAGYPLYGAWERPILGFSDANGNGIIDGPEVLMGPVEVFYGNTEPTRQLTAGTTIRLFGDVLTLSSLIDHRGGFIHPTYADINKCVFGAASCLEGMDMNTPLAKQVRVVAMRVYNSWWGFFQDGSFTRWRELTLTLNAPKRFALPTRAQTLSVTLTARNLKLWTKYTGVDPEVNSNPNREDTSSNPTAPPTQYWLVRVNLGY